jgi:hypothetical protein
MSDLDNLQNIPDALRRELEAALAEHEPEIPGSVVPQVPQIPVAPQAKTATDNRVVEMDTEDKLRLENISLKEALLRSRADAAKQEINRSRDELKASLTKKHGISSDEAFEINVNTGQIIIKTV